MALHQLAEDMDQYLHYVGGPVGALALTAVAAGSAYYLASRPTPEEPLVPLHQQSFVLPSVCHGDEKTYKLFGWLKKDGWGKGET